ncbi:hypothetical protein QYE76_002533 [Lolium multiflorum]|uniref:DUF4218 domain-containing protein n=1 Tax=Lolium multiflorum TaxID=4521 RepID=A0AAD8W0D6_LOLMU|nr:hypothetical protein QYE76_002533 [Lolium multiflorum]
MKSHDCHALMMQILPVAIRGIMEEHVCDTLFGLCNFFDVITRMSVGVRQLKMLQNEIVAILCELEIYFPPAFCDICVHLLLHVIDDIRQLGPTFLHNMMPFERQNGVMKGYVRNRARPDASMAKGFLTYECISFCQNYLSTEDDQDVGLPTDTSQTNPSKEIFSELDEINAQGPIFARSFQKSEEETGPRGGQTPGRRGLGLGRAALLCRHLVPPLDLPFRLLKASVAKPPVPKATIRKTLLRGRRRQSHLGGFRRSPAPCRRGESSPEGLYIIMPASGLMRE